MYEYEYIDNGQVQVRVHCHEDTVVAGCRHNASSMNHCVALFSQALCTFQLVNAQTHNDYVIIFISLHGCTRMNTSITSTST